jgi:hypothetical protein
MNNNPILMIKEFMKQGNPQQLVERMVMNNTNPMLKELVQKAQNGDTKGVEEFARNLYKQQGRDFDQEFSEFMSNFK